MTEAPPSAPVEETSVLQTTRRGVAAASFSIGLWSSLVFWWYPYSLFIATVGLVLGIYARLTGVRVESHGSNLAVLGIVLNLVTLGSAILVYRAMQLYFEGQMAYMPLPWSR